MGESRANLGPVGLRCFRVVCFSPFSAAEGAVHVHGLHGRCKSLFYEIALRLGAGFVSYGALTLASIKESCWNLFVDALRDPGDHYLEVQGSQNRDTVDLQTRYSLANSTSGACP